MNTFLISLSIAILLVSCKGGEENAGKPKGGNAPFVKVEPVTNIKMVSYVDITGTIQPNVFTDISSPANGIIESLMARENQRVTKDQIVAVINPNDRVSLIANSQLQIKQLEQKLEGTSEDSDNFQKANQELEKAQQNLAYAREIYKTIPVICPMNGIVTQRWSDQGSQVAPQQKIITVSDMNSLVIKTQVNERYFEAIKKGNTLPVILNAYPNDTLIGQISLVYPLVDSETRSIKFDVRLINTNKELLPGMLAYIRIPVSINENALTVPEQAVLTSPDNKAFLFTVGTDSIARRNWVETGISSGNKLEILTGVKENDLVVTSGQELLKDEIKVRIVK